MNNESKAFFDKLIEKTKETPSTNNELRTLFTAFKEKFGESVPTEMLPVGITDEKLAEAIKKCLDAGENKIFEILNVTLREDVLY